MQQYGNSGLWMNPNQLLNYFFVIHDVLWRIEKLWSRKESFFWGFMQKIFLSSVAHFWNKQSSISLIQEDPIESYLAPNKTKPSWSFLGRTSPPLGSKLVPINPSIRLQFTQKNPMQTFSNPPFGFLHIIHRRSRIPLKEKESFSFKIRK